jgi:hypothetical protein
MAAILNTVEISKRLRPFQSPRRVRPARLVGDLASRDAVRVVLLKDGFVRLNLDEVEEVTGADELRWLPLRSKLGVEAFGINAYLAAEPGDA